MEQQGDSIGTLVRDVSKHDLLLNVCYFVLYIFVLKLTTIMNFYLFTLQNHCYVNTKQSGKNIYQAWQLWNDGRLHELVDPILGGDGFEPAELMRYAQVALLCAQEDPTDRPTMSDVVALLNFESISLLPDPKQPSDLIKGGAASDKLLTYASQSSRTIDITITSSAPVSTRVRIIVEPET